MVFVCLFILFDALTLLVSQRNSIRPVKHTAVTVPGGSHFGDTFMQNYPAIWHSSHLCVSCSHSCTWIYHL